MKNIESYRDQNTNHDISDKICLVFDATNSWIVAGIFGPATAEVSIPAERNSFTELTPIIEELLKKTGVKKPDWIITTTGPGSFTGTKISVSAARTLSQLWKIPVLGVDSLSFYLNSVQDQQNKKPCGVILDAKQKKVYAKFSKGALEDHIFSADQRDLLDIDPDRLFSGVKKETEVYADDPESILRYTSQPCPFELKTMPELRAKTLYNTGIAGGGWNRASDYNHLIPLYLREDPATAKYPEGLIRQ